MANPRSGGKSALEDKSLRDKVIIAFSLMSVIPILILVYLISQYIFPEVKDMDPLVSLFILLTVVISVLGFIMVNRTVRSIIGLSREARRVAGGESAGPLSVESGDEVGDLAESVNFMSGRIKSYMDQLQDYSHRTAELKQQINGKVRMMTALLRIEELLSMGTEFEEVVEFTTEKISDEVPESYCAVFVRESKGKWFPVAVSNSSGRPLSPEDLEKELSSLQKQMSSKEYLVRDFAGEGRSEPGAKVQENSNNIIFPMRHKNEIVGVLFCGTVSRNFTFDEDTIGLLRVFVRSLVLGYSTTEVARKIKSLESMDRLTGLYTRTYLEERLQDEIDRSAFYQRPCSVVVIKIHNLDEFMSSAGEAEAKRAVKRIANVLSESMPKVGKAARYARDEFVMLLPETNKKKSMDLAERIKDSISGLGISSGGVSLKTGVGVGENPIDGVAGDEIKAKAYAAAGAEEAAGRGGE
ncbi:MAG: diguanylate cyclase [Candidatus Omnitrophica bacterium]|nr:diguanylate cyclase [Candidatus Omnitrophota bacterium]